MKETRAFDCTSCGACCQTWEVIEVSEGEGREISDMVEASTAMPGFSLAMKTTGLERRCVALEGKVGSCVSCRIYAKRPMVCRDFSPGDSACLDARLVAGLE